MERGGGEGDHAAFSEQDFAGSCFFFPQLLVAPCSLAASITFKQASGCPLASRAGGAGGLRWLCKRLQRVWETSPSWLLLSCPPLAVASHSASMRLGLPSSSSFQSRVITCVRLWFCRKGRSSFSEHKKCWETFIPTC